MGVCFGLGGVWFLRSENLVREVGERSRGVFVLRFMRLMVFLFECSFAFNVVQYTHISRRN